LPEGRHARPGMERAAVVKRSALRRQRMPFSANQQHEQVEAICREETGERSHLECRRPARRSRSTGIAGPEKAGNRRAVSREGTVASGIEETPAFSRPPAQSSFSKRAGGATSNPARTRVATPFHRPPERSSHRRLNRADDRRVFRPSHAEGETTRRTPAQQRVQKKIVQEERCPAGRFHQKMLQT